MPDGSGPLTVKVVPGIAEIDPAAWDECAGADNPFLSHGFLDALEASGSVAATTGWLPQHLVVEDEQARMLGAAPLYLKSHSYGEYVFDHAWAEAYQRAGGRYYPKLQMAVPFTPVAGPRLLVRPGAERDQVERALIEAAEELARRRRASSVHTTFPEEEQWRRLGAAGWLQRIGYQFHWENHGYSSFDDFLGALSSRKRKSIRKERREAVAGGIAIKTLTGSQLEPRHWDAFYGFYTDTTDRKWGHAYLTRSFFQLLGERMADRVVLVLAESGGRFVAGALNLRSADTLYGRNWGCNGEYRFLHFEACYYRAIDFAIEHGMKRVEAGAQGRHKIQRGYLPSATYSAHWIADAGLRQAIETYLSRERRHAAAEIAALMTESPFKKDGEAE
ncbi:MAG: N-acetyltransferase [Proteobacteria bacterium]|nr:N-acetyltransferase [Pseudomonadota bacterium]MBI3496682.1 N-acetyltransferase [Pseudomonadota bacterium]